MADTPRSTVEYRRSCGDSVSSATFWSYIQHQMQLQCGSTSEEAPYTNPMDTGFEFVPDDPPEFGTDDGSNTKSYLDGITQSILQNDQFMVDELRCLYQAMTQKGGDTLCRDMLRHETFLGALTEEALLHRDVSVS